MHKQDSGQPDPGSKGAPPMPARHEGPGDREIREGRTPQDERREDGREKDAPFSK